MLPKNLLKKWPSVSAAAAMLLGLNRVEATSGDVSKTEDLKSGDPIEPLILKPAKTKIIPEHLFAGHRSHSSHSSHSSGSGGGGRSYYTPSTPRYVPPASSNYIPPAATPRPSYSSAPYYPSPSVTPRTTPTPTPVTGPVTRIDLTNGAVLYGTILTKSAAGITFKGVDQQNYKIPRLILAPATITALALPTPE